MFAQYTSSLSRYLTQSDPDLASITPPSATAGSTRSSKDLTYDPTKLDRAIDILHKYDENFSRHLKILLDTLNYLAATETVVFLSLCARLSTATEGAGKMGLGEDLAV